ncbi:MAG TPA: sulfatase [Lentisphaeria bacterium]|nr:sulfatase [Lentisphaeria bacterium]
MRVLLCDIDSLRPDHLGCYGYHQNTSPNIDRIAERAVRFTNYYCSDAPCLPSRTALMSGRFGIHTGVVGHGGTAADMRLEGPGRNFRSELYEDALPTIFRKLGMKTTLVSPFPERHTCWTFYAGFNEVHNTGKGGQESAEEVTPVVLKWIADNAADDDWFLYVNYWDPHTPYRTPEELGNPFADDPLPEWLTEDVLEGHKKMAGPHTALDINMHNGDELPAFPRQPGELQTMEDLRRMIDGYDCGVNWADEHVGRILAGLEAQGVGLDDVVVIVTADHGENQGELGIYGEHGTADSITCRVPLIVHWPGMEEACVNEGLHYNVDLAPTLAELTGVAARPRWDGESFAAAIQDGEATGRDQLVISQCAHVCQRSVRFGPWLYMRTYHDGYHLFPKEMLYNLESDPHEQFDLAEAHPEICREGASRLLDWHDDMMASSPSSSDPMWEVMAEGGPLHASGHLKRYVERLEATGRGNAVPALRERHAWEFADE